jgi:hypothetical protein
LKAFKYLLAKFFQHALHVEEEAERENRIEELCCFQEDRNTLDEENFISAKQDAFFTDIGKESYDPTIWLDLLNYGLFHCDRFSKGIKQRL